MSSTTLDTSEIAGFNAIADQWWDENGPMKPLHRLNPTRIAYIRRQAAEAFSLDRQSVRPLDGLSVLDIGCGAGLVSEPLARLGAQVTGIDAAADALTVGRKRVAASGLDIDYRQSTAEDLAAQGRQYDLVTALEIVEHTADPALFLTSCARLVKPGGLLILSTLNRTLKGLALGVVAAEYVLGLVPRGTHDWRKFLRPSEISRPLRSAGVNVTDVTGLSPDLRAGPPGTAFKLSRDVSVNYILTGHKAG